MNEMVVVREKSFRPMIFQAHVVLTTSLSAHGTVWAQKDY